jgi:hypothetical protein
MGDCSDRLGGLTEGCTEGCSGRKLVRMDKDYSLKILMLLFSKCLEKIVLT